MNYHSPPNQQAYYEQVWLLVRQIPYARVATYGQLAKLIPSPEDISAEDYATSSSRWVGLAMAACPDDVPWQRVINSQGKISQRPEAGKQKQLLEAEGLLDVEVAKVGNRLRKYYKLTENGTKETANKLEEMQEFLKTMQQLGNPKFSLE